MSANPFAIACERARLSAEDGRVAFPRYRHEQLAQLYSESALTDQTSSPSDHFFVVQTPCRPIVKPSLQRLSVIQAEQLPKQP
jgi:hypothetical protein